MDEHFPCVAAPGNFWLSVMGWPGKYGTEMFLPASRNISVSPL